VLREFRRALRSPGLCVARHLPAQRGPGRARTTRGRAELAAPALNDSAATTAAAAAARSRSRWRRWRQRSPSGGRRPGWAGHRRTRASHPSTGCSQRTSARGNAHCPPPGDRASVRRGTVTRLATPRARGSCSRARSGFPRGDGGSGRARADLAGEEMSAAARRRADGLFRGGAAGPARIPLPRVLPSARGPCHRRCHTLRTQRRSSRHRVGRPSCSASRRISAGRRLRPVFVLRPQPRRRTPAEFLTPRTLRLRPCPHGPHDGARSASAALQLDVSQPRSLRSGGLAPDGQRSLAPGGRAPVLAPSSPGGMVLPGGRGRTSLAKT
jgi:hypothetical protein